MWRPVFLAAALALPSQALHFFIDGAVQKCFFEELPKDTLVVGTPFLSSPSPSPPLLIAPLPGHYDAKVWDDASKSYISKPDVGVFITVEETFDNHHRVVAQRGSGAGKFTFSAADSGEHRICVVPQNVQAGGGSWFGSEVHASVKFTLDMAIGETSKIESTDKGKMDDLSQKIRDLNSRLQDVRREQVFQRVGSRGREVGKGEVLMVWTGARGRVPRSERAYEFEGGAMDADSVGGAGHHLRVAAVASAGFLHQAEAYVRGTHGLRCVEDEGRYQFKMGKRFGRVAMDFGCMGRLYCTNRRCGVSVSDGDRIKHVIMALWIAVEGVEMAWISRRVFWRVSSWICHQPQPLEDNITTSRLRHCGRNCLAVQCSQDRPACSFAHGNSMPIAS